jgi:hypothetical protein
MRILIGNCGTWVSAGGEHSLALRSDGTIVGWGRNDDGQAAPPTGNNYIAISAGWYHSLALRSDGSIVGWGNNYCGQATPPTGNNYIAISAGGSHSLALRSDPSAALGTGDSIVGWGRNDYGQTTPPPENNYIAISAGGAYSLALRSDGTIVGWGVNSSGQATPLAGNDYVAIAAGYRHSLVIRATKPKLGVVNKRRIDRTIFAYDCNVTFTNLYSFTVKNVQLEMMQASDNMTIIEPNVTFGDIVFGMRDSITSTDTCTFQVDRSQAIEPEKIVWKVKCQRIDNGMPLELTINGVDSSVLEGAGEGKIGFEDLSALAGQWLWVGPAGSIPADITGDGIVNFRDLAELAGHRLEEN